MSNWQFNFERNGANTLLTAGKYCDRNIDVNVTVPILDTTDATAMADTLDYEQTAYVNGKKITGTKQRREYTGEIVSTVRGSNAYAVLAQDELLAEICNHDTLFVRVEFDVEPTAYTIVKNWATNVPYELVPLNSNALQQTYRLDANASRSLGAIVVPLYTDSPENVGCLQVTADGELRCYSNSGNYAIRPSNYKAVVEW